MTVAAYTKARLEEQLSGNGLSPLQNRALALLVESNMTLPQVAAELGINRVRLWEMRKDPDFQAAYREQIAILETSAMQYAIASRVARIEALDRRWRQVNAELDKRKAPRSDLVYVQIALQAEARKEIEGDVRRVEVGGRLEIEQAVRVIRFVEQEPRAVPEGEVVEGEFRDIEQPEPERDPFLAVLEAAGAHIDSGVAQPHELAAIRIAIEERGLNPREVFTPEQFREIYGGDKGDKWCAI